MSLQNLFDQDLENLSTNDDLKKYGIDLIRSDGDDYKEYFDELYKMKIIHINLQTLK